MFVRHRRRHYYLPHLLFLLQSWFPKHSFYYPQSFGVCMTQDAFFSVPKPIGLVMGPPFFLRDSRVSETGAGVKEKWGLLVV